MASLRAVIGRCILSLALLTCPAAFASAQVQPLNPAAPSDRALSPTDEARDMMNRYGVCIAKAHRTDVQRVLSLPEEAIDKALRKLATSDCLIGGRLQMSEPLFRGALYRALYIREFGSKSSESLAVPGLAPESSSAGNNTAPMYIFSNCVVRLSPEHAREFVMAQTATRAEKEAIEALRPALADCLPPKQQVSFTPWGLQASLSEALYKWTVARAQAPEPARAR
jgi:hypothetical protein